jgi:hypothetical protein
MLKIYEKISISILMLIFIINDAFADIAIGGNDHSKDFQILSDLGTTTQSLIFNLSAKTAGTACGFFAILFLCKRKWGGCAIFVICCICFFSLKTLVTNFANFAPQQ